MDDKTVFRNRIEADAMLVLIEMVEDGKIKVFGSEVLEFEINNTPDKERKLFGNQFLSLIFKSTPLSETIINHAKAFEKKGIRSIDALHLAIADNSSVDFLCTCDDKFLKKARQISNIKLRIVTPIQLIMEVIK